MTKELSVKSEVYDLQDATAKRVQHFDGVPLGQSLRTSLSCLDFLIEAEMRKASPDAGIIAKLHREKSVTITKIEQLRIERGQLMSKQQALDLFDKIRAIIVDEIKILPGWEDCMLRAAERAGEAIEEGYDTL